MARTPHNLDFLSGALANEAAAGLTSYSCVFCGPARESLRSGAWFPTQAARETFLPYGGMARTLQNLDGVRGYRRAGRRRRLHHGLVRVYGY